jgi:hypothetical protein
VPVTELNTDYNDKAAFLSFDGLTLYFCRDSDPAWHYTRIFQATRSKPSGAFAGVTEISSLSEATAHVAYPWVSADNLRMYYYRAGSTRRLKVSTRSGTDQPWAPGADIVELNVLADVANPTLTQDELVIVFSGYLRDANEVNWDLWMATRPDRQSPFGEVTNLAGLNTEASDMHPSLAADGLTLYFTSNRSGRYQIFRAHRMSRDALFGSIEHLDALDTPSGWSMYPSITSDGRTLYLGRQKDGGYMDIYASQAARIWHVDAAHGSDDSDGLSVQTAFVTIQRGIEAAGDGDEVLVSPGVYCGPVSLGGRAVIVRSAADAAIIEEPNGFAVSFFMGEKADTVLRNFIIRDSYVGILCIHSAPTITNVTVTGNVYGGIFVDPAAASYPPFTLPTGTAAISTGPRVNNSIFWGNVESDMEGITGTYCCVGKSVPSYAYFSPVAVSLLGGGSFSSDPLFVDPEHGDYHLRSACGRYWPEHDVWVVDDVTSPCIDAGDPTADFIAERKPNGARLNIGAHGGTAWAEMSEPPFSGDVNGDGVFDDRDYQEFMDLWEQHVQPPTRRR